MSLRGYARLKDLSLCSFFYLEIKKTKEERSSRDIHTRISRQKLWNLILNLEKSVMGSGKERDTFVYLAKLSEQAERYEGKESSSSSSSLEWVL